MKQPQATRRWRGDRWTIILSDCRALGSGVSRPMGRGFTELQKENTDVFFEKH